MAVVEISTYVLWRLKADVQSLKIENHCFLSYSTCFFEQLRDKLVRYGIILTLFSSVSQMKLYCTSLTINERFQCNNTTLLINSLICYQRIGPV
jgi:hypothetical protein